MSKEYQSERFARVRIEAVEANRPTRKASSSPQNKASPERFQAGQASRRTKGSHSNDGIKKSKRSILAFPKMARMAIDSKLKAALSSHRNETEDQIMRLEEAVETLGKPPARGAKFDTMNGGLVEEETPTIDAALLFISLAQVEHYEIARDGALTTWAKQQDGHPQRRA